MTHLVECTPPDEHRQRLHSDRYAMPGEARPRGECLIIDVHSRMAIRAMPELFLQPVRSPISLKKPWWSADGATEADDDAADANGVSTSDSYL